MKSVLAALFLLLLVAAANIVVAHVGPAATPYVAFASIGVVLTLRDQLHEAWSGRLFVPRMALLILAGGALSFVLTPTAAGAAIATASLVAFLASETTDTVVYALLHRAPSSVKVNVSNGLSALVDSYLFLTLAFGVVAVPIVFTQFVAKVAGGALFLALVEAVRTHRRKRIIDPTTDEGAIALVDAGVVPASSAPMAVLRSQQGRS